jgi:hypothetical protein
MKPQVRLEVWRYAMRNGLRYMLLDRLAWKLDELSRLFKRWADRIERHLDYDGSC